jgi:hypothetical protein
MLFGTNEGGALNVYMVPDPVSLKDLNGKVFAFPIKKRSFFGLNGSTEFKIQQFWNRRCNFYDNDMATMKHLGGSHKNWQKMSVEEVQKCLRAAKSALKVGHLVKRLEI